MSNQTQFKSWEWFSYYKILNVPSHPAAVLPAILTCAGQDPQGSNPPTPKRRIHRPTLGLATTTTTVVRRTTENKFAKLCKTDRETTWSENNSITTRRTRTKGVGKGELFGPALELWGELGVGRNRISWRAPFVPFPVEWFGFSEKIKQQQKQWDKWGQQ